MKRRALLCMVALLLSLAGLAVVRRCRLESLRTRARAEMEGVSEFVEGHRYFTIFSSPPESLDELRRVRPLTQARIDASVEPGDDPWGNPYGVTIDGPDSFTITCLGADGAPGGTGTDEDIVLHWPPSKDPLPR